jgi:hypothetical protein
LGFILFVVFCLCSTRTRVTFIGFIIGAESANLETRNVCRKECSDSLDK